MFAQVEEVPERYRQLPRDRRQTGVRGLADGGDEVGALGLAPGEGRVAGGEGQGLGPGFGRFRCRAATAGRERLARRVGGVQVPGEYAPARRVPVLAGVLGGGALGRVQADQVVEPVTVLAGLLEQVPAGEGLQQPSRAGEIGTDERRRGRCAELRAGMQPQQPERTRGRRLERQVATTRTPPVRP